MSKKVLVTGASGYIGRYLVERLLKKDYQVVALVRNLSRMPVWMLGKVNLTVIEGDLLDEESLKKAVEGIEIVFHLAAALRTFERENELYQTNIVGLKNLLSACQKTNQTIRFIFASTIDVEKRSSDYARSKQEGEEIVKRFCLENPKIGYLIVRIGNVYTGEEGMVEGVRKIISQNNWQSSILYHCLGDKFLYLIEMGSLIDQLFQLAEEPKVSNKIFTLVDEKLTVKQLVHRLEGKNLISRYPRIFPLGPVFLKTWQLLGKTLKRGDLLIYLNLEK